MVPQTDGYRFLIESPRGIRTVSSDHVTGAPTPRRGMPSGPVPFGHKPCLRTGPNLRMVQSTCLKDLSNMAGMMTGN